MGMIEIGALLALAWVAPQVDPPEERIYGRVTTAAGEVLEGYLRWDRNEASWADFLDGLKEIPWEHIREAEELDPELAARARRERSIEAFGVRITWDRDDQATTRVRSAVRFGHLRALVVLDDRRATLHLKSGDTMVLRGGSTDIGRSMRGVVVETGRGGDVELRWRDVDRVDFMAAPPSAPAPGRTRLHGTLTTRGGVELTGFVAWDLDEVFTSDVLDGEGVDDRLDHEIEFGEIAAIERESERSARVVLVDGSEIVLRGTNDVDRENRGIEISDPSFGRAIVHWDELDALVFHAERGSSGAYHAFSGSAPLRGTVRSSGGEELTGAIRWDNDEEGGWELLDGWSDGIDYDIELGRVRSIEKTGSTTVRVTLLEGRILDLEDSNDVDRDNRGVFVTPVGLPTRLVRWNVFERVDFQW